MQDCMLHMCCEFWTFSVLYRRVVWEQAFFFNTKACYCHLMCRQHEALFNKALTEFPVSKPPTAFPGTLTYIERVHQSGEADTFKYWCDEICFAVFPSQFIHSTEKRALKTGKTSTMNIHHLASLQKPAFPQTNLRLQHHDKSYALSSKSMWLSSSRFLPSIILSNSCNNQRHVQLPNLIITKAVKR